jgi:hypothetical protein
MGCCRSKQIAGTAELSTWPSDVEENFNISNDGAGVACCSAAGGNKDKHKRHTTLMTDVGRNARCAEEDGFSSKTLKPGQVFRQDQASQTRPAISSDQREDVDCVQLDASEMGNGSGGFTAASYGRMQK